MIKYLLLLLLALLADCEWISEGKIFLNDVIVPLPVD